MKLATLALLSLVFIISSPSFANEAKEHAGHGTPHGMGQHHKDGPCMGSPESQQALEKKDFAAWQAAVKKDGGKCPMAEKVTAENFAQFADAHALAVAGKKDEAHKAFEALGMAKDCPHAKDGKGCPHQKK